MAIDRIFSRDLIAGTGSSLVLDVRSPVEFAHAHFPGAENVPLFSDEERGIIGTAYKQQSRQVAVRLGLDFFGPRMKTLIDDVEALLQTQDVSGSAPIYLYCWRGGMRSGAVAWLLDLYGFKVRVVNGGYKSFRRWGIELLERSWNFQVLGGYTGSGKTGMLKALKKEGQPVIDLEGIAKHKGSAFGNLERIQQPSQEMFENHLALALHQVENETNPIWLEDESQRIGSVNIPNTIWNQMRSSPITFIDIPFEARLDHIMSGYAEYDITSLKEAVERIAKRLGGVETKNTLAFLDEGKIREAFAILLHYYDKKYFKSLYNREGIASLLTTVPLQKVEDRNAFVLMNKESKTTQDVRSH